ncbi:hypothetical protein [Polymorphobacter fuscus]|nr:hypothetical protein [Polymorphobacter fuscus]NJC07556.1 hypothetical protein [Polymorphobacter fuscus]
MTPVRQWFGRKRFGWGWTPRSIEGWAVIGAVVLLGVTLAR